MYLCRHDNTYNITFKLVTKLFTRKNPLMALINSCETPSAIRKTNKKYKNDIDRDREIVKT